MTCQWFLRWKNASRCQHKRWSIFRQQVRKRSNFYNMINFLGGIAHASYKKHEYKSAYIKYHFLLLQTMAMKSRYAWLINPDVTLEFAHTPNSAINNNTCTTRRQHHESVKRRLRCYQTKGHLTVSNISICKLEIDK